ncbi:MAG: LPS assembly lipoprotein LptE [Alphaproteobacteria bacterium]
MLDFFFSRVARMGRRRLLGVMLAGLVLPSLVGCYEPLYTASSGDASTTATNGGLEDVKIDIIPNREGQILHNLLLDRFNPTGRPGDPKYELVTKLTQGTKQLGYTRRYEATRANLTLLADFSLIEIATGKLVYHGRSRAVGSYNINTSNYQTDASADDARRRASREIADEIKIRVAAALGDLKNKATTVSPPEGTLGTPVVPR